MLKIKSIINQMSTFQKIQLCLSLIPYYSALFAGICTYIVFAKAKATFKYWIKFIISTAVLFALLNLYSDFFDSSAYIVLKIIGSGVLSALYSIYLVFLQVKCNKEYNDSRQETTQNGEYKLSLKSKVILGAVIVVVMLVFVGAFLIKAFITGVIEDTNGPDDFSLCSISKDDITADNYGSSRAFMVSGKTYGEQSNIDDRRLEDFDYTKSTKSAKSFNGIGVIQATKTDKDMLKINITSSVESGNFAIVIIVDGEHYCDVDINSTQEITLNNIANKTVIVKIVGEDAKMSIEVSRDIIGSK